MAVQRNRYMLIIALLALAVLAAFLIPATTASAAPLTENNHKVRAHQDLNFYPGASGGGRNGSFEQPIIGSADVEKNTSEVPNWETRGAAGQPSETKMHLLRQVSPSITAAEGTQFASVNATEDGILYQDLTLVPNQPYYIKFRHQGGNTSSSDEMSFYFRQKGDTTTVGDVSKSAAGSGWLQYAYLKTATSSSYEIAFEMKSRANSTKWQGNYIDDVQVLTPSFLDVEMTADTEDTDTATGKEIGYRDRYVTYIVTVKNIGETDATNSVATIPIVDGLAWSHQSSVTNLKDNSNVPTSRSGNLVSFNIGETGGKIAAKGAEYKYAIKIRISGKVTGTENFITAGSTVKNQLMVSYDDGIANLKGGVTAGPYVNYSKRDNLAEFIYRESGMSGYIFYDVTEDGTFDAPRDYVLPYLNAEIQLYDATTKRMVRNADGEYIRISLADDKLKGNWSLYGLLPGTYEVRLTENPGWMTTVKPNPIQQSGNKAGRSNDMKISIIGDITIGGTTSATLFQPHQNIGLKHNFSYKTVVKYYVNQSSPATGGSDPDMEIVGNNEQLYTLDYGVPTRIDYTLYRNGPTIDKGVKVQVILRLTAGSKPEYTYPAGGKITPTVDGTDVAYQVMWELDGFSDVSQKFQVMFKPQELPMSQLTMSPSYNVMAVGMKDDFHMRISDKKQDTTISKQLLDMSGTNSIAANKDEEFTYKIDYRARKGTDILYTFFAKVKIPEGQNRNSVKLGNLASGHYTVTELDTNWKYKIIDPNLAEQEGSLGPIYEGYEGVSYHYRNKMQSDKWINGNGSVRNEMQQP